MNNTNNANIAAVSFFRGFSFGDVLTMVFSDNSTSTFQLEPDFIMRYSNGIFRRFARADDDTSVRFATQEEKARFFNGCRMNDSALEEFYVSRTYTGD